MKNKCFFPSFDNKIISQINDLVTKKIQAYFNSKMNAREIIIIIFLLILIILINTIIFSYGVIDYNSFLLNLSTEIIGIILTLLIVDMIIKVEEEKRRRKLFSIGIKGLKYILRNYILAWLHISSSNEDEIIENLQNKNTLEEYLLSEDFIGKLHDRSFNSLYSDAIIFGNSDYRELKTEIPKAIEQFVSDINRIIGYYAYTFDSDTLDILQYFTGSPELHGLIYFRTMAHFGDNKWFQLQNPEFLKEYLTYLVNLLAKYNDNVSEGEKLTKENITKLIKVI